ncbi:MAG TPA: hypothetical protein VGO48_06450 [Conexibacter sp.]|jgi:hypothetical protein|nr:hypothetical protein [Conexibacter sp.]
MKRSVEALVVVPMLVVIAAMAILGLCGLARAEPAQQFLFQVKNPRPGDLGVRVHVRRFDTTGVVPATPTELSMRMPRGVGLDRAFLTPRYLCDGPALRDALDARPSGMPFTQRLAHLDAFARELARSHTKHDRAQLANVRACARGRLGGGTGLIDARDAIAVLTDPIPFGISMFLSRGTIPGAVAALVIIGSADERAPIVRRYPVVAGVHAVEVENFVSDPTPDGLYGLKLLIHIGPINGFQVSIAEVNATARSLQLRRGTCLTGAHGGRCVRRQRADASLFVIPRCPASGHFSAQLFSAYPPPMPSQTTTLEVPCPRYLP